MGDNLCCWAINSCSWLQELDGVPCRVSGGVSAVGRPHGVYSVLQHVLPVHSLGAQRKLPVLGSNARGLVISQGCEKSALGDPVSALASREATLGSPQKETQRNHSK